MTILPKKKNPQQKTENETADSTNHSYPGDNHSHPTHQPEGRERFNFSTRSSPPTWSSHSSREEKRPAHPPNNEYSNSETGPSHSKRRHQTSPHRSARKSRSHSGHNLRPNTSTNLPGPSHSQTALVSVAERKNSTQSKKGEKEDDPSGYNSGDEYEQNEENLTEEELEAKERAFEELLRSKGYAIRKMGQDGACLFRAVADQIYGDQEMHGALRQLCTDYIAKNADYYSSYVTEDIDKYVQRKRSDHIHGNHVEIQAMSEMFNRRIEVYHYSLQPINIFQGMQLTDDEPIRLSYHRKVHYNSIIDPYKATVGVGLGLPSFKPDMANKTLVTDAIRASENLELEQAMLEDKLRASDWEATNEAIEEQVARESYLQWLKENEFRARKKSVRSATATSSSCLVDNCTGGMSPQSTGRLLPRTRGSSASSSPKIHDNHEKESKSPEYCFSPKAECSGLCGGAYGKLNNSKNDETALPSASAQGACNSSGFSLIETASFMNQLPPSVFGLSEWEDSGILAKVLAESQQEYIESLKRSANN